MTNWYLVERTDGKKVALGKTRHEARGIIGRCHGGKREWYDIVPILPTPWVSPRMTPEFDRYPEVWDVE